MIRKRLARWFIAPVVAVGAMVIFNPAATTAAEKYVEFGKRIIALPSIQDLCWVRDKHRLDRTIFGWMDTVQRNIGNKLLGFWIPCKQLEAHRSGIKKNLKRWVVVAAPLTEGRETTFESMSSGQFRSAIKQHWPKRGPEPKNDEEVDSAIAAANSKYLANPNAVQVGKSIHLGILSEDQALYFGMIQKAKGIGPEETNGMVGFAGLIRGVGLFGFHYKPYKGTETIKTLLKEAKAHFARTRDLNP
jgi:hypothetical protein